METPVCSIPGAQEKGLTLSEEDSCSECSCEACCNVDSSTEDSATSTVHFNFTKIKDLPKVKLPSHIVQSIHDRVPPHTVPVFQSLPPPARPLTDTATAGDPQGRPSALLNPKKQRHCSFCRIHGFPVNIKGHKAFCQFREKCMCKGCALIRCNQQVSKSQVRLRRQKDMEADLVQVAPSPARHHTRDPLKKNPMCFKCWVHDTVRVPFKGHRNVCPYARCPCPNCSLNADRKRLTRELRQLTGPGRDTGPDQSPSMLSAYSCLHLQSPTSLAADDNQNNDSVNVLLSSAMTRQCKDSGLGAAPFQLHRTAGDWQLASITPSAGLKQENNPLQSMLGGVASYPVSSLPQRVVVQQEPERSLLANVYGAPPCGSRSQTCVSSPALTLHTGMASPADMALSQTPQSPGLYSWLPQNTCFKTTADTAAVLQATAGDYTFSTPCLPPRYQACQAKSSGGQAK